MKKQYLFGFLICFLASAALGKSIDYHGVYLHNEKAFSRGLSVDMSLFRVTYDYSDVTKSIYFCEPNNTFFCLYDPSGEFTFYVDKGTNTVGDTWKFSSESYEILKKYTHLGVGEVMSIVRYDKNGNYSSTFQFGWNNGIISFMTEDAGYYWLLGDFGIGPNVVTDVDNHDRLINIDEVGCMNKSGGDRREIATCLHRGKSLENILDAIDIWGE